MKKDLKRYIFFLLGIIITALGSAFVLKAAIGVSPYNAMCTSIADITEIKIGTITFICNCSLVLLQWILLGKSFKLINILQVVNSFLFSIILNYIFYQLLGNVTFGSYYIRFIIFLIALIVLSFGVAVVIATDVVPFPPEGACLAIAQKTRFSFATLRQGLDVLALSLTIILGFFFDFPLPIREGTLISALTFSRCLGFFIPKIQNYFYQISVLAEPEIIQNV